MTTKRPGLAAARKHRTERGPEIVQLFAQLLALANVTGDVPALEINAAELVRLFNARGADVRSQAIRGVAPVVVGTLLAHRPHRRLGVYVHYDGQPVDETSWDSDPFHPTLRTAGIDQPLPLAGQVLDPQTRIYARGAADDKAPFVALLAAIDALTDACVERDSDLVFLFEGEEESGSPHLQEYIEALAGELSADLWLICDGPVHPSGRPQVAFGVRGYAGFELTVYGPERELHSGHFGNWVPNPAHDLARLMATFKDDSGNVLIDGFYNSTAPITEADLAAIAALPQVEDQYQADLGFGRVEPPTGRYAEHLLRPSLNPRGLGAAGTGSAARNVIPAQATASFDIRLAAGNDPVAMLELVESHLRTQGYQVLDRDPTTEERRTHQRLVRLERDVGYPASRTAIDHPATETVVAAAAAAGSGPVVRLPTFGGSAPLHHFNELLDAPVVILPIANYDNNQHGSNENLRLGNLWYGIDLWGALLAGNE